MIFTVFLVQLDKFPSVLTLFNHIVIKLIPKRRSSELWSWEFGNGTEEQTVDYKRKRVNKETEDSE